MSGTDESAGSGLPEATILRNQLARSSVTAESIAHSALDRIRLRDPLIQAWRHLAPVDVLEAARQLDRAVRRGLLHGIPIGIKDNILTRDMPTRYGSAAYEDFSPGLDAACVRLLREAGALILGKTHTVEFASTGLPPPTRNPANSSHTPGGSSSGSAAAVADGHVPLALGTQTGGSIIRPASFCGVWAVKPSWNLVSLEGVKPFAPSLDTLGWFGRSADYLLVLYETLVPDFVQAPTPDLKGARIGICRTPLWPLASACVAGALARTEALLVQAGASVSDINLPSDFANLSAAHLAIMRSEGRTAFLADLRLSPDQLSPGIRRYAEADWIQGSAEVLKAHDLAARCRAGFDDIAARFDVILTPSSTGEAPMGLSATGDLAFNGLWTLLQVPCVNIPGHAGKSGLPVGITATGPRRSDAVTLAMAKAVGALFHT